jgi:hypothetical protein
MACRQCNQNGQRVEVDSSTCSFEFHETEKLYNPSRVSKKADLSESDVHLFVSIYEAIRRSEISNITRVSKYSHI